MNETDLETQNTQDTNVDSVVELDTSYQMHVVNILDSVNTVQVVNMFLLVVLIGCVLGGCLWKHLKP